MSTPRHIADRLKGADRPALARLRRLYPNNQQLLQAIARAERLLPPAPLVPTAKPRKV